MNTKKTTIQKECEHKIIEVINWVEKAERIMINLDNDNNHHKDTEQTLHSEYIIQNIKCMDCLEDLDDWFYSLSDDKQSSIRELANI